VADSSHHLVEGAARLVGEHDGEEGVQRPAGAGEPSAGWAAYEYMTPWCCALYSTTACVGPDMMPAFPGLYTIMPAYSCCHVMQFYCGLCPARPLHRCESVTNNLRKIRTGYTPGLHTTPGHYALQYCPVPPGAPPRSRTLGAGWPSRCAPPAAGQLPPCCCTPCGSSPPPWTAPAACPTTSPPPPSSRSARQGRGCECTCGVGFVSVNGWEPGCTRAW
jgi:hypothetical protein